MPDHRAVFFLDAIENVRGVRAPAAVGKNGVGQGELGEGDFAAPEKRRRERAQRGANAGRAAELDDRIDADGHADADRGAVLRFGERLPRGHRSFVTVLLGFRSPFAENAGGPADHDRAIIERGIFDQRAGEQAVLEGGRVNERLDRGAGGPPGLEGAVKLVVLEIASADEDQDAGGLVIERDERALQIIGRGRARSGRRAASRFYNGSHRPRRSGGCNRNAASTAVRCARSESSATFCSSASIVVWIR